MAAKSKVDPPKTEANKAEQAKPVVAPKDVPKGAKIITKGDSEYDDDFD
jgi:hypothetical protein